MWLLAQMLPALFLATGAPGDGDAIPEDDDSDGVSPPRSFRRAQTAAEKVDSLLQSANAAVLMDTLRAPPALLRRTYPTNTLESTDSSSFMVAFFFTFSPPPRHLLRAKSLLVNGYE